MSLQIAVYITLPTREDTVAMRTVRFGHCATWGGSVTGEGWDMNKSLDLSDIFIACFFQDMNLKAKQDNNNITTFSAGKT